MTITEADLEAYARRVRPYFPPHLRDVAEELALAIARSAGPKTKKLRPATLLEEILSWMGVEGLAGRAKADSLDQLEQAMALADEFVADFPAELLTRPAHTTFGELVEHVARQR